MKANISNEKCFIYIIKKTIEVTDHNYSKKPLHEKEYKNSKIIQEPNLISFLCYVQFPIKLKLNFDNSEYCNIWREKA